MVLGAAAICVAAIRFASYAGVIVGQATPISDKIGTALVSFIGGGAFAGTVALFVRWRVKSTRTVLKKLRILRRPAPKEEEPYAEWTTIGAGIGSVAFFSFWVFESLTGL